ncbi:hypothetical protein ACHQM5_027051 [Ranunculus cassubicifolius]
MTTTGRSEGMNSVFKDYFSLTTSLRHFITKFEHCLEAIAIRESAEDYITEHTDRVMEDGSPFILMHAAKVYTRNVYDKFKKELMKAQSELKIYSESPSSEHNVYIVRSRKIGDHVEWHVTLNLTTLEGHCECKKFDEIPQKFILRRRMKGANQYRTMDSNNIVSTSKNSNLLKVMHGSQLANQLVAQSLEADECFTMLVDTFTSLSEKFADLKKKREEKATPNTTPNIRSEESPIDISQILLLNPNISQPKGRPTKKDSERLKRGIESSQEHGGNKQRKCSGCGGVGVGHDYRKCPNPFLRVPVEKGKDGATIIDKRPPTRKRNTQGTQEKNAENLDMDVDQIEATSDA